MPQLLQFPSLVFPQVAKHLTSQKQLNLHQSWKIGLRSGKKGRRRMNLKTQLENLAIRLLTPYPRVFHHCNCFPRLCCHHRPVDTRNYQELIGDDSEGRWNVGVPLETSRNARKVYLGTFGEGVRLDSPNPYPVSDQYVTFRCPFSKIWPLKFKPRSDLFL